MKVLNSLEELLDAGRLLHQNIETVRDHATIRGDLEKVSATATELAASLRSLAGAQSADMKNHLAHAATLLQATALSAKSASESRNADPKRVRAELLHSTRNALQGITLAVSAQRAASRKRSA